ncbi:MAG: hypothetical protein C5B49_10250 [Bdellovibrio sp.]|nr:MAG: hypothetical protein C5B49_10250 [Bdellovibrio sp.]
MNRFLSPFISLSQIRFNLARMAIAGAIFKVWEKSVLLKFLVSVTLITSLGLRAFAANRPLVRWCGEVFTEGVRPINRSVTLPAPYAKFAAVLDSGVQNQRDLALVDQLFHAIEPLDGGLLAEAAKSIPHVISPPNGSIAGEAHLSYSRGIERVSEEAAEKISFYPLRRGDGSTLGPSPITVKHERVHAVPFSALPPHYQIPIPEIPRQGNLFDIYFAVLQNKYLDETMAFSSQIFLEESFHRATGLSLFDFKAQAPFKNDHEKLAKAFQEGGMRGIYDHVSQRDSYQPYRVSALYLAILIKKGMTDLPNWGEIMKGSGVEEVSPGVLAIDPKAVLDFFETQIKPLIGRNQFTIALYMMGLGSRERDLITKAGKYFTGQMPGEEGAAFLRNDFDEVVRQVGLLMGDKTPDPAQVQGTAPVAASPPPLVTQNPSPAPVLPPPAFPLPAEAPSETLQQPIGYHPNRVKADKIELMGKFTELLAKLDKTSDSAVVEHLESYLQFARHTDDKSAERIFNRLLQPQIKAKLSRSALIDVAVSLIKTGRVDAGVKLAREAIGHSRNPNVRDDLELDSHKMKILISTGHDDLIREALDSGYASAQSSIAKFHDEATNPKDFFNDNNPEIEPLQLVLGAILEAYKDESHPMPSELQERVISIASHLWKEISTWSKNKIVLYNKKIARVSSYQSIDELTAKNPQWGEYDDLPDMERLIGVYGSSQNLGLDWFTRPFLENAQTFRFGLSMLLEHPDSTYKLATFSIAAQHLPPDFTASERQAFMQNYWNTINAVKNGFARWNYTERCLFGIERAPKTRRRKVAQNHLELTHLYWRVINDFVRINLASPDAAMQAKGWQLLRSLSSNTKVHPNKFGPDEPIFTNMHVEDKESFRPHIFKAVSYLERLNDFKTVHQEREALEEINRNIFLNDVIQEDGYAVLQIKLYVVLLQETLRLGYSDLYQQFRDEFTRFSGSAPDQDGSHDRDDIEPINRLKTALPILDAVGHKGLDLHDYLERVKADIANKRKQFSLGGLIDGLSFLSEPEIFSAVGKDSPGVLSLAHSSIDLYLQSVGSGIDRKYFTRDWRPLVKALKEIPLADQVKDDLFSYLVEKATPEPGVIMGISDDYELSTIWEGFKVLDFLLGNPKTPKAEAILLDRLIQPVRDIKYHGQDPRVIGSMMGLGWIYKRVKTPEIINPDNHRHLARLRDTHAYKDALHYLHSFSANNGNGKSAGEILREYENALTAKDAKRLHNIKKALADQIANELYAAAEGLKNLPKAGQRGQREVLIRDDLNKGLLNQVARDWLLAAEAGETKVAAKLFDILATNSEPSEVVLKQSLYYDMLKSNISILQKRRLFHEISRTTMTSSYANAVWKMMIKQPDREKEELFYKASMPYFTGTKYAVPSDALISWAVYLPKSETVKFLHTFWEVQRDGFATWKFDPLDEYAWEIYCNVDVDNPYYDNWQSGITSIFEAFLSFKYGHRYFDRDGRGKHPYYQLFSKEMKQDIERHFPQYNEIVSQLGKTFSHATYTRGRFTRAPSHREVELAMAMFQRIYARFEKNNDRIQMSQFKMPEIFKDQKPVTQFLLSRFFVQFPIGERQELLSAIKHASKGDALRLFFLNLARNFHLQP